MPKTITLTLTDELLDAFAEYVARHSLSQAGMTPASSPAPAATASPGQPEPDPWDGAWPSQAPDSQSAPATPTAPPGGGFAPPGPGPVAAPSQPAPAQAPPGPQAGTYIVNTPKGQQSWTLGSANAPVCLCGEPSAHVQGFSNGKAWRRWACAKGAGEQWRDKCNFSQWA